MPDPAARVVVFEPTYQLHGHIARITGATVVAGERRDDFTLDPDHVAERDRRRRSGGDVPVLAEQPDRRDRVARDARRRARRSTLAWSSSTRPTPSSRRGRRSTGSTDDGRLVVVRTFSKTWSMAAARLGYAVAPTWVVDQLDKVVLPYHLDAAKQLAGTLAVRHVADMERRVSTLVEERGRLAAALGRAQRRPGSRPSRPAPTSSSCASTATTPTRSGNASSTPACSSATAAAGRGSTVACA